MILVDTNIIMNELKLFGDNIIMNEKAAVYELNASRELLGQLIEEVRTEEGTLSQYQGSIIF